LDLIEDAFRLDSPFASRFFKLIYRISFATNQRNNRQQKYGDCRRNRFVVALSPFMVEGSSR
jgi:hypothetical protein